MPWETESVPALSLLPSQSNLPQAITPTFNSSHKHDWKPQLCQDTQGPQVLGPSTVIGLQYGLNDLGHPYSA